MMHHVDFFAIGRQLFCVRLFFFIRTRYVEKYVFPWEFSKREVTQGEKSVSFSHLVDLVRVHIRYPRIFASMRALLWAWTSLSAFLHLSHSYPACLVTSTHRHAHDHTYPRIYV